jgi:hypothetical protein
VSRTISSAQTFFAKFCIPPLLIGIFGTGIRGMFLGTLTDHGRPMDPTFKWVYLAFSILACSFTLLSARLKRIILDDGYLRISNFRREIVVPLRDIAEVTENRWINAHPVTVRFTKRTEFGDAVVFIPKARMFALFSSHPIVDELREAAFRARGGLA